MKKKSLLALSGMICVILIVVGLSLMPAFVQEAQAEKARWRLGTTQEGGFTYGLGVGVAKTVSDFGKSIYVEAVPTAGFVANLRLIENGDCQLAFTQGFNIRAAYHNEPPYDKKPIVWRPHFLTNFFTGEVFILTRADTDIKTWDDLAGKKFFPAPAGSGVYEQARHMLTAAGLWDKVKPVQMSWTEVSDGLKTGKIDAFAAYTNCNARANPAWLKEVDIRIKLRYVTPSPDQMKKCEAVSGMYGKYIPIPPLSQDIGVKEKMWASISPACIVCAPNLDEGQVYELIKIMFEHSESMIKVSPGLEQFHKEKAELTERAIDSLVFTPIHPGAAKYYKEIGIWKKSWIEGKRTERPR